MFGEVCEIFTFEGNREELNSNDNLSVEEKSEQ